MSARTRNRPIAMPRSRRAAPHAVGGSHSSDQMPRPPPACEVLPVRLLRGDRCVLALRNNLTGIRPATDTVAPHRQPSLTTDRRTSTSLHFSGKEGRCFFKRQLSCRSCRFSVSSWRIRCCSVVSGLPIPAWSPRVASICIIQRRSAASPIPKSRKT